MKPATNYQPPATKTRPTKKQRELLGFIEEFIGTHGYSPSYREIMSGLNYNSVATVALHVNNLIKRGHLHKRDHSARSLELTQEISGKRIESNEITAAEEKWLVEQIDYRFKQLEQQRQHDASEVDGLYVLVGALKVLGLDGAAQSFITRLSELKQVE